MWYFAFATALLALLATSVRSDEAINGAAVGTTLDEAHGSLRSLATRKNHAVCYQILDQWWDDRLAQKVRGSVNEMDALCEVWNGNPSQCNNRTERMMRSGISQAHMDAFCTSVGAHSPGVCQANPCNSLNSNHCTLQGTSGQCQWFTSAMISATNKHRKTQGWSQMPTTAGCYRNPCNQPEYGKLSDATCEANGVPNHFTCTWCKGGSSDPKLNGKGMGCQQIVPTSTAACAPVNSTGVRKESIFQLKSNSKCQCSVDYPLCKLLVDDKKEDWKPRYPVDYLGVPVVEGPVVDERSLSMN